VNTYSIDDDMNRMWHESNAEYLYRGINEFKRGYKPRSNFVKDENRDLFVDSHNI
jgi:hypothetical protein